MKPSPENMPSAATASNPAVARRRGPWLWGGALLVILAAAGLWWWAGPTETATEELLVDRVRYGDLVISVDGDEGVIRSGQFRVLRNELEGKSTIISMVEPGTQIKKGQLIMELDASGLKDRKVDQQIVVQLADAAHVRARENLAVVKKQAESNIKTAELNLAFAKQDVVQYVEGDYQQELRNIRSAIKLSEGEAEEAKQVYAWSKKLFERGFLTQSELNRDKLAADRKEIDLQTARGELELLEKYTHKRQLATLESEVDQKKFALLLVKHKAASDVTDAKADLYAKKVKLDREKEKLAKIEYQISRSKIIAPIDGMVLYLEKRVPGPDQPLEVGMEVHERQPLVRLPTTSMLLAELKVHESQLRKISEGMPVEVTTDAVANQTFWGKIKKISTMPDPTSRYGNPHLKVYTVVVEFVDQTEGLRPGMSCKGKIIVKRFEDVTYVPIQAVVQEEDESVVYLPGPQEPIRRPVKVGLDNNVHIIVKEGLARDEQVLIAPTLANSYAPPSETPPAMPDDLASEDDVEGGSVEEEPSQEPDQADAAKHRRDDKRSDRKQSKKVLRTRGDS